MSAQLLQFLVPSYMPIIVLSMLPLLEKRLVYYVIESMKQEVLYESSDGTGTPKWPPISPSPRSTTTAHVTPLLTPSDGAGRQRPGNGIALRPDKPVSVDPRGEGVSTPRRTA